MIVYPSGHGVVIDTGEEKIAVDAPKRVPKAVHLVTHAHWDHLGAVRRGFGYSNTETSLILRERGIGVEGIEYFESKDFSIFFPNAGHIVGSAQILLSNGRDILVTGDFKVESDIVVRGADTENVDILVMDTTFSVPYFKFPSRKILYRQLKTIIRDHLSEGKSVVLFGYSVGKSQELTALLNSFGMVPYVLPETHRVNSLYGLKDKVLRSLPREPSVFILPPKFRKVLGAFSLQTGVDFEGLFCSGWNREMPLSSHADWFQTIKFVEKVSPEVVITYGENATSSAYHLKMEGFDAVALRGPILL